jgi:uncharacterized protein YbaR (Trm112 family)
VANIYQPFYGIKQFMNNEIFKIIVCPQCHGELLHEKDRLICEHDKLAFNIVDGIPVMLLDEAVKLGE